jgi:hypothetical protein
VHGGCERVPDGLDFGGVIAAGDELVVRFNQQNARTHALRGKDVCSLELAPIDAYRIAPQARPHGDLIEEFGTEFAEIPEERAGRFIPIEVEESLHPIHAGGMLLNAGNRRFLGLGGWCREVKNQQDRGD